MGPQEKLNAENGLFASSEESKRTMKFMPFIFLGFLAIWGWRVWVIYQRVGATPRAIFLISSFVFMFFFYLFISIYGFKIRQRRFELSSEGLTCVEGNGKRIVVSWDHIGQLKEPMDGGALTLFDKSGKKLFTFSAMLVEGYEQLKNRIYDEFDKRNPKSDTDVLVYPMSPSARTTFLACGVGFLLFLALTVVSIVLETYHSSSHFAHPLAMLVMLYLCCLLWSAAAYYCLVHGSKVSKSKIEISNAGIARLEKDGSKVFIRWDDVARLTKRERMKQIGVYGLSDGKKIMVDFQFERFEQIRDRILNEFEKRFRLPAMPVTYGTLPVFPNPLPFLFIATFVGLIILAWVNDTRHQTWAFVFIEFILISFYTLILYGESRLVKTIVLDGQGLTLYKVFGKIFLPWDKLAGIDQESKMVQHGRYFLVKLTVTDGKTYPFDDPLARRLEIFITLKKLLETKKAKSG